MRDLTGSHKGKTKELDDFKSSMQVEEIGKIMQG